MTSAARLSRERVRSGGVIAWARVVPLGVFDAREGGEDW